MRGRPRQAESIRRLTDRVMCWNMDFPPGTPVRVWPGFREGPGRITKTTTPAYVLGGHTPVVWVDGVRGCIALTHVQPIGYAPFEMEAS